MQLLSPWSGLIAGAVAIPLLLMLYLLKLRRQRASVASTLLWQQAYEDLQVNAPFQRLRWSALLAIQLLALLALILAFAEPVVGGGGPNTAARVVLLIDRSASMNTVVDPQTGSTRLDQARQEAHELVDRLARRDESMRCMIIAFAGTARVFSGFEQDTAVLHRVIDAIEPTDEQADLQAALDVAGAFTQRSEDSASVAAPPRIMLLSDGCVGDATDPGGFALQAGVFEYIAVEAPTEATDEDADALAPGNLGITAFAAERDFEDPITARLFVRLSNASTAAIRTVLTIQPLAGAGDADAQPVVRTVTVPPRTDAGPGSAGVTASMTLPRGGVLLASHAHSDALSIDNTAALTLPPPRQPRLALVHPVGAAPDAFVLDLFGAMDTQRLDVLDADAFASIDAAQQIDAADRYDLLIFDRVPAQRLGATPTLSIGATPAGLATIAPREERGQRIATWRRQHPVMRHVQLDGIVFSGFGAFDLPVGAEPLASGPQGPVIALVRRRGAAHVVVGFEILKSNWSIDVSFTVFMLNVLDHAMLGRSGRTGRVMQPGTSYTLRPQGMDVQQITISGPQPHTIDLDARDASQPVVGPRLTRAGRYTTTGADTPFNTLAVSVLSEQETDNTPRAALRVNAQQQEAGAGGSSVPIPLWPYLLAAAAGFLIIEWLLWSAKAGGFVRRG